MKSESFNSLDICLQADSGIRSYKMIIRIRSALIAVLWFSMLIFIAMIYIPALMIFGLEKTVWLRKIFGYWLIRAAFCRLKVTGMVPKIKQARIYVLNHQSMFDALMISAAIPENFSVIAKKSLKSIPVFGSIIKRMGFIFIDRRNHYESMGSVKVCAQKIRAGTSVLIFAEGTRTKTGEIGEFKRGAFILAQETKAPIVPVRISGAYEANSSGWQFCPGLLTITFGNAITEKEYRSMTVGELSDLCRTRIMSL